MKKTINCLLIILVLLGMTGCGNPAGGESDLDSQPVIQLGDCELTVIENNSIKIALPEQIPDRASKILVYRKAASDENWGTSWYMYKNAQHGTDLFVDKYLEANKEYVYKMEIKDGWDRTMAVSNSTTIKAPAGGIGELILNEENIEVTYDEKSGVLSFSNPFNFTNANDNFERIDSGVEYTTKDGTKLFKGFAEKNQTTIDMTKLIWDDKSYGKYLTLVGLYCFGQQGDIFYKVGIKNLADKILAEKVKVPAQITVPDLRPELTVTNTNEGLKIDFPLTDAQKSKTAESDAVWIFRYDEWRNEFGYIKSTNLEINTIIDPYVEKDRSYSYEIHWRKGEDKIFRSKISNLVKANENGTGNLLFDKETKVTFDEATGIMKLNPTPSKEGNTTVELTYKKPNSRNDVIVMMNDNGEFNFKNAINSKSSFYFNDLEFQSLNITRLDNDITYGLYIEENKRDLFVPGIPAKINARLPVFVDNNCIHIPVKSDFNANYITIYRNRGKDDRYRISFNPKIGNVLPNNEIFDEYVTDGKEYTYEVEYKDGDKLLKTVKFYPVKAIGGKGELNLTRNPKVDFDDGLLRVDDLGETSEGFKVSLKYTDWESIFYNIDKIKVYDLTLKYPGKTLKAFIEITTAGDQNLHRTQNIVIPNDFPSTIKIPEKHTKEHVEIGLMGQNIWKIDGTDGRYATIQLSTETGKMTVKIYGIKDSTETDDGIIEGVGEGSYSISGKTLTYNPPKNNEGNGPQKIIILGIVSEDCIKIKTSAFNILNSDNGDQIPNEFEMVRQISN